VNDGGIFVDYFIANLLLSVTVQEFWRSVRIWQSYGKKYSGTFFFRTRCSFFFYFIPLLHVYKRTSFIYIASQNITKPKSTRWWWR